MDRKSALVAAALALAAGRASAQSIIFTPSGPAMVFTQLFDPDGGVFAAGAFTNGLQGSLTASGSGRFSLTYLGQESAFSDGIRIAVGGAQLTEFNHVGDSISAAMTSGTALSFTFFGSDGTSVTNGQVMSTP